MRVTTTFLLLVCACFAEQQKQQDQRAPVTGPLTTEQVAAQVGALLKPSNDPGEWCKTPIIGLIVAEQSTPVPAPARKADPPK